MWKFTYTQSERKRLQAHVSVVKEISKFSVFIFHLYLPVWPFSKKTTIAASGILSGAADHHSHILPGVDDGVETVDEVLRILAAYEDLGIKELWLTPHIMEDIPNTPDKLNARFAELKERYTGNITLHLAAEYMIDNHLRKLLQETPPRFRGEVVEDRRGEKKTKECPKLLPIGKSGKHLLVETSYFNPPMRFRETLRQIKSIGYHPLLAHPERYMYMDESEYRRLREEGVRFQLNIVSLAGGYGKTVRKKALWLLNNDFYHVAGSDLHCEDAIEYITSCKLDEKSLMNVAQLLKNRI